MQLSHYVKTYPYPEMPGYRLVFSTKRFARLLVPEDVLTAIEEDDLTEEETALLLEHGIITDDPEADRREATGSLDAHNSANTELRLTVLLNMDCNFDCIYCYEGDLKGRHYLSEETAGRLVAFIEERFTEGKDRLLVDFHGGEPLMSRKRIMEISERLKPLAEARGGTYEFTLEATDGVFENTKRVTRTLVIPDVVDLAMELERRELAEEMNQ